MPEVGIRALKQNASRVVADATRGQTITITDRGRPVAQLSPIPASRLEQLIASGGARPARRDIATVSQPLPGPDLSAELAAMRAAERY